MWHKKRDNVFILMIVGGSGAAFVVIMLCAIQNSHLLTLTIKLYSPHII